MATINRSKTKGWNETLTKLRDILSALYPSQEDSVRILDMAGIPRVFIRFSPIAINNWHNILIEAKKRDAIPGIIDIAIQEYPGNEYFKVILNENDFLPIDGPGIETDIQWHGPKDKENLEKIIGPESTLLPIAFLEGGLKVSRAVAKITRSDGSSGTGFLIRKDLILTNNHVIDTPGIAAGSTAVFDYQKKLNGSIAQPINRPLKPELGFKTSEKDDWTVIRLTNMDELNLGFIKIGISSPSPGDRVSIIQHPGGKFKQIALHHNHVVYVDDKRIQYLTDTLPGSSGSPVFDQEWNLVALHHSGGWLREPNSKRLHFRNEGIHVQAISNDLKNTGID